MNEKTDPTPGTPAALRKPKRPSKSQRIHRRRTLALERRHKAAAAVTTPK